MPISIPKRATAVLVLSDGTLIWGKGVGVFGETSGEVCFNTSITGYQEILTDPSYAGQVITFTAPHIGNTGTNNTDIEGSPIHARGLIIREAPTTPSNWRSENTLPQYLHKNNIIGISDIDTRALTQHIRDNGAQPCLIAYPENVSFDVPALLEKAQNLNTLNNVDLAKTVTCEKLYKYSDIDQGKHIVVIDYGVKLNILRCLENAGCHLTVVPCTTSAKDILNLKPDGIFLSNGPGDPAATGSYAVPTVQELLKSGLPIFGICLGHQLLSLAIGGKTQKMAFGHRGGNHPVRNIETGKVEITSQNHGFEVLTSSLPDNVTSTHVSLFDNTNEGIQLVGQPVFSVQYHPESSPGPQDSHYLFDQFINSISTTQKNVA